MSEQCIKNDAERAVARCIRSHFADRLTILEILRWAHPRKELEKAFARLRLQGIIYRVTDGNGEYQTDWTLDDIQRGYRL